MGTRRSSRGAENRFAAAPQANIQRSSFRRSCGLKTTLDVGDLVPVFVDEVLPGDTFSLRAQAFARLATPLHPLMDNLYLDYFFFFVPNRLVWENWAKFNGEQENPEDSTEFEIPTMTAPVGGYSEQSLQDYLGLPTKVGSIEHSALWTRAYNLIWNEWFRDENLSDSATVDKGDGPDTYSDYIVRRRMKRHDYFTSSLPWPQKGPAVELPMAGNAPLVGTAEVLPSGDGEPTWDYADQTGGKMTAQVLTGGISAVKMIPSTSAGDDAVWWNDPKLEADLDSSGAYADLSSVTAATINDLRQAFQLQKMYERDARGGTRYAEILRSHFGVISPDARLQRPEYLGGGASMVSVLTVPQTSETSEESPQGNLAAYGLASSSAGGFTKSFVEHGVILGLVASRSDLTYQQGMERMFSRSTRWDFYWPSLAHLGEQEVLSKEIYMDGTEDDGDVWGYQERYAEYRYKPSRVTGRMRSNCATPLDTWHLALDFDERPVLDASFMQEYPPIDRVVAVPSEPHFLLDMFFDLRCARPMPVYSVPGLIDHF